MGKNILFHSIDDKTMETFVYLLNWIKDNLSFDILKECLLRRSEQNQIQSTILLNAFRCQYGKSYEKIVLILNFMKENFDRNFLMQFVLTSDLNILQVALVIGKMETIRFLFNWVEIHLGIDVLKQLILTNSMKNNRICLTTLLAAAMSKSKNKEMIDLILDFISKHVTEQEILSEFVLANGGISGRNILNCLIMWQPETALDFFNWTKEHLSVNEVKKCLMNGRAINDTIIETALHGAIKSNKNGENSKLIELILDFVKQNIEEQESLKEFVLANAKIDGGNILYYSLDCNEANTTAYLLEWVKHNFDPIALQKLVTNGRVVNNVVVDTALHKSIKCCHQKVQQNVKLILNFLKLHTDQEFLKKFMFTKDTIFNENALYFSMSDKTKDTAEFSHIYIKEYRNINELLKLSNKEKLMNNEMVVGILKEDTKNHFGRNEGITESILNMLYIHMEFIEMATEILTNWITRIIGDSNDWKFENIVCNSLKNRTTETAQYLLKWVENNLGIDAVKEFMLKRRADSNEIEETIFHKAIRCQHGKSKEKTEMILNFVDDTVKDSEIFLKNLFLNNYGNRGENILYYSLQYKTPKTAMYLFEWLKKYVDVNSLKDFVQNGRVVNDEIVATTLHIATYIQHDQNMEVIQILLDLEIVLANDKAHGGNILYYSMEHTNTKTALYLLNWVKDNLGIDALKEFVQNGRMRDNEVIATVLHNAIYFQNGESKEMIELALNFAKDYIQDQEFIKNFVLSNDKSRGGNVLYYSLQLRSIATAVFLLDWVQKYLGNDLLKKLVLNGVVIKNEIMATALHSAVIFQGKESKEIMELILNRMKKHTNKDFLRELVLKKDKFKHRNILDYSVGMGAFETAILLFDWVKENLGIDALNEFVPKK